MFTFRFDQIHLPSQKNNVNQDKLIYQTFVSGLAFITLKYANKLASSFADLIEQRQEVQSDWASKILENYGILLEETEETILLESIKTKALSNLISQLRDIEERYTEYYFEQVENRLARIRETFDEAEARTIHSMKDYNTDRLNEYLTRKSTTKLVKAVWQLREQLYPDSLTDFHKLTYGPTEHYVMTNSGQRDDAQTLWENTLEELNLRIDRGPKHPSGYRWYQKKALLSSFFQTIARNRWIDKLRKLKLDRSHNFKKPEIEHSDKQTFIEEVLENGVLEQAISQLGEPCASIIRLHWIEGKDLQEVADLLNLSYVYVRTIHHKCLNKLSLIIRKNLDSL